MFPFLIAGLILVSGLGVVAFLLWNENRLAKASAHPDKILPTDNPAEAEALLTRLGLQDKGGGQAADPKIDTVAAKANPVPTSSSEGSTILPGLPLKIENAKGTVALRLDGIVNNESVAETELALEVDDLRLKIAESQAKYQKLDALFQEKSADLEKCRKELAVELRAHKEFNKVKDILEKEIKDAKDRNRDFQHEVATAQAESQASIKRISQLEERLKRLEKDIREKEEAIKKEVAAAAQTIKEKEELAGKVGQFEAALAEKEKKIGILMEMVTEHSREKHAVVRGEVSPEPLPEKESTPADAGQHEGSKGIPAVPSSVTSAVNAPEEPANPALAQIPPVELEKKDDSLSNPKSLLKTIEEGIKKITPQR